MRAVLVCLLLLAPGLGACTSGAARAGSGSNPNVIGNWELQELQDLNALEAIQRLRPAWLRQRGIGGPVTEGGYGVVLHLDGSRQPELAVLETIRAGDVQEMRYLNSTEATTRFGTGYANGAILVTTVR